MTNKNMHKSRPGYEYLTCYQLGLVIQELTDEFCDKYISKSSRTHDQMVQAARSNPQNVAEGYTQESRKGYIYLSGIAHGSNEELGKDYVRFLKKNNLPIWPKDHQKVREFRGSLPNNPQEAANMLLTLCQMEGYLLTKLVASLKQKHQKEGGLTEELYQARRSYRGY